MARHVVAATSEIPPGGRKLVTIQGREVVVFNVGGEYFALLDRCPHAGGSLCKGRLIGAIESNGPGDYRYSWKRPVVRCAWHAWEFDLRTGRSLCDPARLGTRNYAVDVTSGEALAEGPYLAETFEVSVAQDYVVIEA